MNVEYLTARDQSCYGIIATLLVVFPISKVVIILPIIAGRFHKFFQYLVTFYIQTKLQNQGYPLTDNLILQYLTNFNIVHDGILALHFIHLTAMAIVAIIVLLGVAEHFRNMVIPPLYDRQITQIYMMTFVSLLFHIMPWLTVGAKITAIYVVFLPAWEIFLTYNLIELIVEMNEYLDYAEIQDREEILPTDYLEMHRMEEETLFFRIRRDLEEGNDLVY